MLNLKLLFSLILSVLFVGLSAAQVVFDPIEIEVQAEFGEIVEIAITISNESEELLEWEVPSHPLEGGDFEPWELIRSYNFGETVEDARLSGIAFVDNNFFVSGAGEDIPQIYVFHVDGELVRQFPQPAEDRYGMRDLTWDGELLWGAIDDRVYGITLWGEVEHEWEAPYNPTRAITWDTEHNVFWLGATTSNPIAYDRDGNQIEGMVVDRYGMRIYGLSYWENSPNLNKLLVHHKEAGTNLQMVQGINVETGDSTNITTLRPDEGGTPLGSFVTDQYDHNNWVMMTVLNNANTDRVDIWQIRNNWYFIDDVEGSIDPDENHVITMELGYESLEQQVFETELTFLHNFDDGITVIPVALEVTPLSVDDEENDMTPQAFTIESAYPNPFNSSVRLSYTLSKASKTKINVFDINGDQVAYLSDEWVLGGNHTVTWDAGGMPTGIYFARMEASGATQTATLILIR